VKAVRRHGEGSGGLAAKNENGEKKKKKNIKPLI